MSRNDSTVDLGELWRQHRPDVGDQDIGDSHQNQPTSGSPSESAEGDHPSPGEGSHGESGTMTAGPGPGVTVGVVVATTGETVQETAQETAEASAGESAGASASRLARFGRWTVVLDFVLLGLSISIRWWPQSSRPTGLFVVGLTLVNWHGLAGRITPGHGAALDEYGPGSRDVWVAAARRNLRLSSFLIIGIQTLIEMRVPVPFL